ELSTIGKAANEGKLSFRTRRGGRGICCILSLGKSRSLAALGMTFRVLSLYSAKLSSTNLAPHGKLTAADLFVEEAGLRGGYGCCGCGGFAAGDADNAEDGQSREGGARDVDAVGVGIEIGRGEVQAVIEEGEQVVGNHALEDLAVLEAQLHPQAVEFRAAQEGLAFRLEVFLQIADKINRAHLGECDLLALAVRGEKFQHFGMGQARGVQEAANSLAVEKFDHHFFVGGGWGTRFQSEIFRFWRRNHCRIIEVMLI